MKKIYILSIALFLCGISIPVDAQFSGEAFIPERFLPESTLAVCIFTNIQETAEKLQQTLLFEALHPGPLFTPSTSIKAILLPVPERSMLSREPKVEIKIAMTKIKNKTLPKIINPMIKSCFRAIVTP